MDSLFASISMIVLLFVSCLGVKIAGQSESDPILINSLIARFQSNGIRGYVLFTENGTSTSISTKIFDNGSNNETFNWKIYNAGYMIDNNVCNVRNNIYLNQINVSSEPSTLNSRSYINLLNVTNLSNLARLFFVLKNGNQPAACASILQISSRKVVAKFNENHLVGQVMFSQESPIDPTLVDIELNTNKFAYSYGIDELPSIARSVEAHKICPNINNIIFNPTNISPFSVPIEGLGTSDQYAIGDLSGKYGTLMQKSDEKISTVDFNLPLFGTNSVVGRALVFYAPNGTTIACSNLEMTETEMVVTFATFDKPVQGQIIFKQPLNKCNEDTSIYFEISRSGENETTSHNHEWSIHRNPIFTDNNWSTSECVKTDEIFNPFNKTIDLIYQRDCSTENVFGCVVGDLHRKLSPIEIVPYKVNPNGDINLKKFYFIDTYLPLCGPNSVVEAR
ncbi:hypothetical protein QR98_0037440 [Sarcoptes scabiei]|uniref:Uncharacterized protein n=1 Tax=Sarcoptes scabiei TaxID=52283 RepID=A0A132A2W3_SARSC|nr:hypothetical protein QR98_0037440 [Sarcoptes scabiei]